MYLKTCISPDLERSDFDRQSFQYTWLNSYLLFRSIRESLSFAQASSTWPSLSSFDKSNRVYSITCWRLRYLISFILPVWLEAIPIPLARPLPHGKRLQRPDAILRLLNFLQGSPIYPLLTLLIIYFIT